MKNILILTVVILAISCKEQVKELRDESGKVVKVIDISTSVDHVSSTPMKLSELATGTEYIQLGFPEGDFKPGEGGGFWFTPRYIYEGRGQYDRQSGKFIQAMGKIGRGPGEFLPGGGNYVVDPESYMLYTHPNYFNGVYVYDSTNTFVKSMDFKTGYGYSRTMYYLGDGRFFFGRDERMATTQIDYLVVDVNREKILKKVVNEEYTKKRELANKSGNKLALDLGMPVWFYQNRLNYYDPITDGIYELDTVTWQGKVRYQINRGKYKPGDEMLDPKMYQKFMGRFVRIANIDETSDYFFIAYTKGVTPSKSRMYMMTYNKKTEEIICRDRDNWIENDFGGAAFTNLGGMWNQNQCYNIYTYDNFEKAFAGKNRDELTETGKKEYDIFAGKDPVNDVYKVIRIVNLK